ncbi:hypothetical protein D9611_002311 [Ephemerocybe angulata]|uniref:Uncharacterized protein n=1 Tax=Ephemerocybe angulata TaxID=980116 RepID=A0A8H5FE13_9AGAR|nr:hypothetical protein D9611_002311 [Tulosesus angulatus]
MSLFFTSQRMPVNLETMFNPENLEATLARHATKPSIHLTVPRLRYFNHTRPFIRLTEDVVRNIFEYVVDGDVMYTAFASFSRPHPRAAPLSIWGISRQCAQWAEAEKGIWAAVSGMQHQPNSPHVELVKRWIQRADPRTPRTIQEGEGPLRPLSFHIAPPNYEAWGYTDEELGDFEDEMTPRILRVFMQHAPRWLDIAFDLDDTLADVYLGLIGTTSNAPGQVRHLELLANKVSTLRAADEIFKTIELFSGTVTKVMWSGPQDFVSSLVTQPISLPQVEVLGMDVCNPKEIYECLQKLRVPKLVELKICFCGPYRGPAVHWREDIVKLLQVVAALPQLPKVLWIHEDCSLGS